jgi:hypothetical protein
MKWSAALVFATISMTPANAYVYNYACTDHGKSYPLRVDDAKNVLEWKGAIYKIRTTDCGRAGWHAEGGGEPFDFCTATKGKRLAATLLRLA